MGWLRDCLDVALQIIQFNPFSPILGYDEFQKPLQLPTQLHPSVTAPSCPGTECPTPTPFQCSYPALEGLGWEFCNTETSRDCWIRDPSAANPEFSQYDVRTNYEKETPPGITREYWLEVSTNETVKPDGIEKILGNYFNGTYPGPTLEACWGDQLVIHVTNTVPTNGTTIHWHGIRQLRSNEMDGVNGITQCPIAPDIVFTYNFTAAQYGHTWYHSHYSLQYPEGVAAPLIIHGPTSANWDIDLGPILISDWVHQTAYIAYEAEMFDGGPATDSILVNGKGHWQNDTSLGSYFQTCFTPGKKHLMKLINGAMGTSFVFSIDNHNLTVVANDLVAVEPFEVESLFIGIGQRYTVIVEAKNETEGDYWMRTVPTNGCSKFSVAPDNNTAIIRYNGASETCPGTSPNPQNATCADIQVDNLNPMVPWCVDQHPQNNITKDTFFARLGPNPTLGNFTYVHWVLDPNPPFVNSNPLFLNFSDPTILDVEGALSDPNYVVIEEDFDDGFVYLVLDSSTAPARVTHPIHLHGSDFVVLAQGNSPWNETTSPALFNYNNPPRRDVAMLPGGGFLAIAFKPDNPGAWLLHCHIAWHASSGLALQVLIRPRDMPDFLGNLDETRRVCQDWKNYPLAQSISDGQIDSGI